MEPRLVQCPDCGHLVSTYAAACPGCGCAFAPPAAAKGEGPWSRELRGLHGMLKGCLLLILAALLATIVAAFF